MKRVRVAVAEFKHETNCFCPNKAGRKEYEERYLKDSDEVIPYFKGTGTEIGGMIAASENERFEIIPIMAAFATPTGLTTKEMFEFAKDKIISNIATKNVDGILLSLHGAMVSEAALDGEGELLKVIRKVVGPSTPIVTTLDLHGNVTDTMVENADAFFPYETYPHIDVLIVTGYRSIETATEAIKNGAAGYIVKPFDKAQILKTVKQTLK